MWRSRQEFTATVTACAPRQNGRLARPVSEPPRQQCNNCPPARSSATGQLERAVKRAQLPVHSKLEFLAADRLMLRNIQLDNSTHVPKHVKEHSANIHALARIASV